MRRLVAMTALLASGCAYTFDDEAPALPLVGDAPATASLPRLNHMPATGVGIVYGHDGAPWAVFSEVIPTDMGMQKGQRFVRLIDPSREEILIADDVLPNFDAYYIVKRDMTMPMSPTELTIHFIGSTDPDDQFELPTGSGAVIPNNENSVFVYWPTTKDTTSLLVIRRDKSVMRTIPLPPMLDPERPFDQGGMFFLPDGKHFITRDGTSTLVRHAIDFDEEVSLGVRPRQLALDQTRNALITCGADGVRSVPLDGSPESVLDPEACDADGALWFHNDHALYAVDGALEQVPLDGSGPPSVLLEKGRRIIAFGPMDAIVFSKDPSDKYVGGAGDGWIGDWRFMERGLSVSYSNDGKRLRWLEHAAQPSGVGELVSAAAPGGDILHLARNVRRYDQLRDGRVLAASNRAFRGVQNRIIAIDEDARVAHWVADQASDYAHIPGTNELLVDVVSGPSGFDVVRVPIPPK
jgi:hypothetical protein